VSLAALTAAEVASKLIFKPTHLPPSLPPSLPPLGPAPTAEAPITGPTADVFLAALTAAEVATKLIKPGNTNQQVTDAIAKVAEAYGVNAMQGTLMHQMKR